MPKKTFRQAKNKHTLLIQLKDNQQNLLDDVKCLVKTQQPYDEYRQDIEMEHGRIARRTTRIYKNSLGDFILDDEWNEYIKTVVEVERSTDVYHTKTKKCVRRKETAYYLCNGRIQTAQSAGGWVVRHWGIENKNHYVRDVTLLEDASRIRKNPYNFSVLRSTVLNILRINKVQNIKGELYKNALHWTRVFNYPQVC